MKVSPLKGLKLRGIFLKRVNRFTVEVKLEDKKRVLAYLPNPGRLWEILFPGVEVLLLQNKALTKLPYTLLASKKKHHYVFLHTHLTNFLIKNLIQEKRIPFLLGYEVIKKEATLGKSRFDLLLEHSSTKRKLFLEVKTCTLFGKNLAMFPDAPTERGRRHLLELASLVEKEKVETLCLYVVMNPEIKYFLPSYHIDFNFTESFIKVCSIVPQRAISLKFDEKIEEVLEVKEVEIPSTILESEAQDRGVYLLLIELIESGKIKVGEFGSIEFTKGFYVYVGSAKKNLSKRIERHLRKRKTKHWHIDYLIEKAKRCKEIILRTSQEGMECFVARKLSQIAEGAVLKFGSSDCNCNSHLYYFGKNPLENRNFVELITALRLDILPLL